MTDDRRQAEALREPETAAECLASDKYLSASELGERRITLRIARVFREELADEDGTTREKTTLAFERLNGEPLRKRMVACRTNVVCLRGMFGDRVADWRGKRITIFAMPNVFRGQPGIRIHGSPDLERDVAVEVKLPRRKAFAMTMHRVEPQRRAEA